MFNPNFLAIDLGAESGRVILGGLQEDRLQLKEVHRFENKPVRVGDSLYWDVLRLWTEIQQGLALAYIQAGESLVSLGIDTWGVDFGLLDANDELLGNPVHYRDRRTDGMLEQAYKLVPREEIYRQTGIQFMQINSLYQLLALSRAGSPLLEAARTFLNMLISSIFGFREKRHPSSPSLPPRNVTTRSTASGPARCSPGLASPARFSDRSSPQGLCWRH